LAAFSTASAGRRLPDSISASWYQKLKFPQPDFGLLMNGDPIRNGPIFLHYGAGEAACKPMIAAVANAI
jgi:hypothetical protein